MAELMDALDAALDRKENKKFLVKVGEFLPHLAPLYTALKLSKSLDFSEKPKTYSLRDDVWEFIKGPKFPTIILAAEELATGAFLYKALYGDITSGAVYLGVRGVGGLFYEKYFKK